MKRLLFLIPVISLVLFSCRKDTSGLIAPSIEGTWKMIQVKDNTTNVVMTKPGSIFGNVVITFVSGNNSSGIFAGNTPTNTILPDKYSTGLNQTIVIPELNMTKIAETSWGLQFVINIRGTHKYSLEPGELLNIETTDKTLTFQKS